MIKQILPFAASLFLAVTLHTGCSKSDNQEDETPKAPTKTELITKAAWKYEKIDPALAAGLIDCFTDNSTTFNKDGKGNSVENAKVCPTAAGSFNWNFLNNEAMLHLDAKIIPVGSNDFKIVTLTETSMVLSQDVTSPMPATVTITLKH
jgi:hypothetical protein